MSEDIRLQLEHVFRDVFDNDSISIHEKTTANDVEGWDSLNHAVLIFSVEKKFGIKFTAKEVHSLKNAGDLIELISRKAAHAV